MEAARQAIANGDHENIEIYADRLKGELLQPVINGTGIVIHTNLGRSPLKDMQGRDKRFRFSNLEFDLKNGRRGSRDKRVGPLIAGLVGADAAIVVNNGAAAVFLALSALAKGKAVLISRGELVEIGGGFRIPDVCEASGARLVEVGTTNKTRLRDYENAKLQHGAEIVLKVHASNYKMVGFTEQVSIGDLRSLGTDLICDIGSGLLDENAPWLGRERPKWLGSEPGARQALLQGADLITFSGDKLMGGPQAGIIAGKRDLVETCSRHPLYRAMRPGSLVLSALQETVAAYLDNDAQNLPLWKMARAAPEELLERAKALGVGEVVSLKSAIGGGSLPGIELDSYGIALPGDQTTKLRSMNPPIIARMEGANTVIDLRTVDPGDDPHIIDAVGSL